MMKRGLYVNEQRTDHNIFARVLVHCLGAHRGRDFNWGDPAVMDAVGEMLDEAEKLAEKAKAAIKVALADEDSRYHSVVTFFMEFHRDDVGPDIAAELFPGTDPFKLSFAEMVDFLKLKRFGSLVDDEMDQQVFIMDLSFNPEITDELMVIYFDLNQEIFCITHES